jgi:SPX domain protein involved in polyphosphate accumulation
MKFGEQILAHLTPEWRKQYIHYDELRDYLTDAVAELPPEENVDERQR